MKKMMYVVFLVLSQLGYAKTGCHLWLDSPAYVGGAGFFHNFNIVLGCLDLYDRNDNLLLTIDFDTSGLYYEASHGTNWWSYYFEDTHYPLIKKQVKKPVLKRFNDGEKGELGNTIHYSMSRLRAHDLIEKYIHVKKEILEEVEAFYHKQLEGAFVIGVHYRGTDKWTEAQVVSYEAVLAKIDELLVEHPEAKIFVATDEPVFLEKISLYYGEKVCHINAQKIAGYPVHYYSSECFLKGREALMDCLLLAKSDILVRTNSNLSSVSAFFNPRMQVINLNRMYEDRYKSTLKKMELSELHL